MNQQQAIRKELQEIDVKSLDSIAGGLIGPDGDLKDFPVWAWPYINVARVDFSANVFAAKQLAVR